MLLFVLNLYLLFQFKFPQPNFSGLYLDDWNLMKKIQKKCAGDETDFNGNSVINKFKKCVNATVSDIINNFLRKAPKQQRKV